MNAPAYCSTKPAAPPIPQAPSRSPTPAVSAQDFDDDVAAFFGADFGVDDAAAFLLGDAGVVFAATAVARRDERRAGVGTIVWKFFFSR